MEEEFSAELASNENSSKPEVSTFSVDKIADYLVSGGAKDEGEEEFGDFREFPSELLQDEAAKLPEKKTEYYYQGYKYRRPRQSDFDRKQMKSGKLFDLKDLDEADRKLKKDASILIEGFGMRNLESFQRILNMSKEEMKKWKLKKLWRDQLAKIRDSKLRDELEVPAPTPRSGTTVTDSETDRTTVSSVDSLTQTDHDERLEEHRKRLEYILGIEEVDEEAKLEEKYVEFFEKRREKKIKDSSTKSMQEAQIYLRSARIFDLFQFVICHLLSSKTSSPIEFILELLNKCILYRSGTGEPPLLYEKHHIKQLFKLMDRMNSGYVDLNQYKTAMNTFGICTFNSKPETTEDGLITEEIFIDEIYDAQLTLFNDLIKIHPQKKKKAKKLMAPPVSAAPSVEPPYFIPSDFFRFSRPDLLMTQDDGNYGEYEA